MNARASTLSHKTVRLTHLSAFSILSIALAFGCGNNGGAGTNGANGDGNGTGATNGAGGGTPISGDQFLVATSISLPDGRTNLFSVVNALDETTVIDPAASLEVPGFSRLYAPPSGGYFAVGNGEDITITRFDVDEAGRFVEQGRISFQGVGTTFLGNTMAFLSATKAYYVDAEFPQIVVWDPARMEVTSTIDLSMTVRDGDRLPSTTFFNYVIREDRMMVPIGWYGFDGQRTLPGTGLLVLDTVSDTVVSYAVDERCTAAVQLVQTANGDAFYSRGYRSTVFDDTLRGSSDRPGCVLRLPANAEAFDPDYLVNLEEVSGGLAGDIFPASEDGFVFFSVLDESLAEWDAATDPVALQADPVWRRWRLNLATGTAELAAEFEPAPPDNLLFRVDDRLLFSLPLDDFARSRIVELTSEGERVVFENNLGFVVGLYRVRGPSSEAGGSLASLVPRVGPRAAPIL